MEFYSTFNILADAASTGPGMGGLGSSLMVWLMILAGMWFLMIAPQRKKQKQHQAMIAALTSGDEIVTSSGIYGTITNVRDDRFVVKIADNTKVEIAKAFVQEKATPADSK